MPKLLTATAAEKLKPDPNKRREVKDGGAPGLYLCIQPSGHKSWVLRGRRPDGRPSKVTLGPLDLLPDDGSDPTLGAPLNLRSARVLANQLLRQKAQGVDIAEVKVRLSRRDGVNFPAIAAQFIRTHARPNNRRWKDTASILGLDQKDEPKRGGLAARWSAKPFSDISGEELHNAVADARRKNESRGRALAAALGKLFSWATEHRLISVNPMVGVFRPKPPPSRDRVLRDAEVKAIWRACESIGYPFGSLVQLLILTGQRRNEVVGMRRSELAGNDWLLPSSRTKNKQTHMVPLPSSARDIIDAAPQLVVDGEASDLVFTTTGVTSISGFSKYKKQLDKLLGDAVEPWRLHDARRTMVTGMAELGVQPHIIEAVVNHISGHKGGVAGVYNRAIYAAEKKAALQLWADHVGRLVA